MEDGTETTRTAGEDCVRVRKTVETGPEGAATVTLAVAHEGDEPATLRVTDPALEAVPPEAVELDAGGWRTEAATFEREFAGGESATVGYRLVGVDPERFESADADPVVERTDPAARDLASRERSDAVRELVAGDRESLTAETGPNGVELGADPGTARDGPAEGDADGDPPGEPGGAAAEPSMDLGSGEDGKPSESDEGGAAPAESGLEASLSATPSGGVARRLLEELREGHVDEETAAALREALEPGRSHDVRIKHLQSQVSDLAAYVEMLETFVDERGTLEEAFEEVTGEVATLDGDLGTVRSDLEGLSETVERDVGALEADLGDLRDDRDDLADRLDRLERQLRSVEERLQDLEAFENRLLGAFQGGDGQE